VGGCKAADAAVTERSIVSVAPENDRIEIVGRRITRSDIGTLLLVAKGYVTGSTGGRKGIDAAGIATLVLSTREVKNFLTTTI
jgi:hypothetical protein